jgi:hypothetical protein
MLTYNDRREFRMEERLEQLERFGRNAERFARNDSNGQRNAERLKLHGTVLWCSSTLQGLYVLPIAIERVSP